MTVEMRGSWATVPADQLVQHPKNPNNGDIDQIITSLKVNGCYRPVYVSSATNHILAGHHLYQSLVALGVRDIPVSWVDGLTETQEVRIVVADNQIANLAQIDDGQMIELLDELAHTPEGLLGTGYTDDDMALMEAEMKKGLGFGDGLEDFADEIEGTVECPNCGHTFTHVIGASHD